MEALDPFPTLRPQYETILRVGACHPRGDSKDAGPTTAAVGKGRYRQEARLSGDSAQGGVQPNAMGAGVMTGAGRVSQMGRLPGSHRD